MRKIFPLERPWVLPALAILVAGCQQVDQALPFALADDQGATLSIGATGGTLSVPPGFSIDIPAGALTGATSVSATPLITEPFPQDAGVPVPGTAFAVGPVGTPLAAPARVELAVPPALLGAGEEVLLALAVRKANGDVVTYSGTYDVTNGVLTAEVDELGPMAAVVSVDAIAVGLGLPPTLSGGTFPTPAPPAPVGAALSSHGGVVFEASCSPDARQCYSSGLIKIWADDTIRDRMGDQLFLLNPTVSVDLDFISFDLNGLPTELVGAVSVGGELRARFNSSVTGYALDEGVSTGPGTTPTPTSVQVSGSFMQIGQTTTSAGAVEFNEQIEYGIVGIGTTEMMVVEIEADVEFDNDDGTTTVGHVIAHVRLRTPQS